MTLSCPGYPYTFNQEACKSCRGRCCNGESGYIWVDTNEIKAIAEYLSLETDTFIRVYLKKVGYKFSIRELKIKDNYACVFYDEAEDRCSIYEVRPEQCRTFPFWPYYKDRPEDVASECPGVII